MLAISIFFFRFCKQVCFNFGGLLNNLFSNCFNYTYNDSLFVSRIGPLPFAITKADNIADGDNALCRLFYRRVVVQLMSISIY